MAVFQYVATDYTGQKIKGQLEAKDSASVVATLRKSQLIVISITETKTKESGFFKSSAQIKLEDQVVFSRQLAALVKAGISLVRGLNILFSQIENKTLREIIASLITKIEAGSSLSDAMSNYPDVFSSFYINMIKAGEFSGALDVVLDRLALHLESVSKLNRKVRAALVYPAVVITVAIAITALIFIFVIPKFQEIFSSVGMQLPVPTRIVLAISNVMQRAWFLFPVFIFGIFMGVQWLLKVPKFRLTLDRQKLSAAVIGKLMRKIVIARFSRTLATLLKSGVSILAALEIASKTAGNMVIEMALNRVISQVSKGERIGASLAENKIFTPLVVSLVAVGEETGDISSMLEKIAGFYEEEVDNGIASLTSLIEPVIIVFLGVVIGGIVIAIFLPILQLTQTVGR